MRLTRFLLPFLHNLYVQYFLPCTGMFAGMCKMLIIKKGSLGGRLSGSGFFIPPLASAKSDPAAIFIFPIVRFVISSPKAK